LGRTPGSSVRKNVRSARHSRSREKERGGGSKEEPQRGDHKLRRAISRNASEKGRGEERVGGQKVPFGMGRRRKPFFQIGRTTKQTTNPNPYRGTEKTKKKKKKTTQKQPHTPKTKTMI